MQSIETERERVLYDWAKRTAAETVSGILKILSKSAVIPTDSIPCAILEAAKIG